MMRKTVFVMAMCFVMSALVALEAVPASAGRRPASASGKIEFLPLDASTKEGERLLAGARKEYDLPASGMFSYHRKSTGEYILDLENRLVYATMNRKGVELERLGEWNGYTSIHIAGDFPSREGRVLVLNSQWLLHGVVHQCYSLLEIADRRPFKTDDYLPIAEFSYDEEGSGENLKGTGEEPQGVRWFEASGTSPRRIAFDLKVADYGKRRVSDQRRVFVRRDGAYVEIDPAKR